MRNYLVAIITLSVVLLFSCKKDKLLTDPSAKLEFSTDTVIFDTVFTQVGSVTKHVKIYNPHNRPMKISNIYLAGGTSSNFRINIDGTSSTKESDIDIRGGDSLYIFVEVTVDPNNATNPMVITDSIVFETNGNEQDVDLVAWGQDAYFWVYPYNSILSDGGTYAFPTDKPHVFYGYLWLDSATTLIIEPGTKMHFHQSSGIIVNKESTINVLGTVDDPVIIQGDRLEWDYREEPGQWGMIYLAATSRDNVFEHAVIKNGTVGIRVDSVGNTAAPTLTLKNTRIENMSALALWAQGSEVVAENSLFANCGQYVAALTLGGEYEFRHCTFANYWEFDSRDNGMLLLNNYYEDVNENIQSRDLEKAYFGNCIVYGNLDEEIGLDKDDGGVFNYTFDHCLLKTEEDTSGSNYIDVVANPADVIVDGQTHDPVFNDYNMKDYHLFEESAAIDRGEATITNAMTLTDDLEGNPRNDGKPDMGAFEYIP